MNETIYLEKENMIVPNLTNVEPSKDKLLEEKFFTNFFDKIIYNSITLNPNQVCSLESIHILDYFITINFTNLEIIIPETLKTSISICANFNPNIEFYIIPIKLIFHNGAHSNVVIIDHKKLTIEFYEPHGIVYSGSNTPFNIQNIIYTLIHFILHTLSNKEQIYTFENTHNTCPIGLQAKQSESDPQSGHCLAWSLLFVHLKLLNLTKTSDEIIKFLNKMDNKELDDYIKKYTGYIKTISQNNNDNYKVYSENKIPLTTLLTDQDKLQVKEYLKDLIQKYILEFDQSKKQKLFNEIITFVNFPEFHNIFFSTFNSNKLQPSDSPKRKYLKLNKEDDTKDTDDTNDTSDTDDTDDTENSQMSSYSGDWGESISDLLKYK